jgi:1,4-dihydroxy-6-naphthoate synthase
MYHGPPMSEKPTLQLAHSPDPDDAFMWWPLFELDGEPPRINTGRFRYVPVMQDIETLNQRSMCGELEITAMSCAQYPHAQDLYAITSCGSSMGETYGPKLVTREPMRVADLRDESVTIAVPGERTSAFAALSLLLGPGRFRYKPVAFDTIIEEVASGTFAAGVVIHEGQLTFEEAGLHLVEDLGRWWHEQHELPLPLGINTVRRDLEDAHGEGTLSEICTTLLASVEYALEHREESIRHALQFARGLAAEDADAFVRLYVNDLTLDFGDRGRRAVEAFLGVCAAAGLLPPIRHLDFVRPAERAR